MTDCSQMTNDQINERLAVEVMGWHRERNDYVDSRYRDADEYQWVDGEGRILYHVIKSETLTAGGSQHWWHPITDITQALMCTKKWVDENECTLGIYYCGGNWTIDFYDFRCSLYPIQGDSLPRALCEAILMEVDNG